MGSFTLLRLASRKPHETLGPIVPGCREWAVKRPHTPSCRAVSGNRGWWCCQHQWKVNWATFKSLHSMEKQKHSTQPSGPGQSSFTFRETLFPSGTSSSFLGKPRVITSVQNTRAKFTLAEQKNSQCDLEEWRVHHPQKLLCFWNYCWNIFSFGQLAFSDLEGIWPPLPP